MNKLMTSPKFAFLAAEKEHAQQALRSYQRQYKNYPPEEADVLIVLGGDGYMLHVLHQFQDLCKPVYGINYGSVGFLMNADSQRLLEKRVFEATETVLNPLKLSAVTLENKTIEAFAINEVSLFRQTAQAAKIQIYVDGILRLDHLISDGVLVATPAGSTAYNLSVHGPIIPIGAKLLALTPISAFRPRHWRGALLPDQAVVSFEVLEAETRRVSINADSFEVQDIRRATVKQETSVEYKLLFDLHHNLEQRIIQEQFLT
jgi:NAD+ kinase